MLVAEVSKEASHGDVGEGNTTLCNAISSSVDTCFPYLHNTGSSFWSPDVSGFKVEKLLCSFRTTQLITLVVV